MIEINNLEFTSPQLILADEHTGNLDPANKKHIMRILFDYADSASAALVTVTHDHSLLDGFDRVIDFRQFQGKAV